MRLEHYPRQKLEEEIKKIVGKHLDLQEYKLFFFGSRVTGKGDERSDIDVGIAGPAKVPGHVMVEIEEEVDLLPTLYSIDIVDFSTVSEDFKQVAEEKVEYFS